MSYIPQSQGPVKRAVRLATTTNLTLSSPGATIDGVSAVAGDRILVKDQLILTQNGIYIWNGAATAMTRASDSDGTNELFPGAFFTVTEGSQNSDKIFLLSSDDDPIVIGTTDIEFSAPNVTLTGPAGGDLTGTYPNPTIGTGKVTSTHILDGTIVNGDINASAAIAYSKLNLASSITSSDIVDGTIVNGDINASAAIAYSKLNLASSITSSDIVDGTIVNGDINASAAIAVTKLANAGASATRLLGTNASNTNVFDSISGWGLATSANPNFTGTITVDGDATANLYRTGAGNLKTDGDFTVASNLNVTGKTTLSGSLRRKVTTTTGSLNASMTTHDIILADTYTLSLPLTITLPSTHSAGDSITVKDCFGTAGVNNITVATNDSDAIDGSTNDFIINVNWGGATFISNGTDWLVI